MIVYSDVKRQFVHDVKHNIIADKIFKAVRAKGLNAGYDREYTSWENSMQFMSSGIRSASPERAHQLILNTYKTLLTRGQKGCYVYCEDIALRDYIVEKLHG